MLYEWWPENCKYYEVFRAILEGIQYIYGDVWYTIFNNLSKSYVYL